MALRLANKINRNIIQNFGKIYTGNAQTIATKNAYNIKDETRTKNVNVQKNQIYPPPQHVRTIIPSIGNAPNDKIQSSMNIMNKNMQNGMHKLQPSTSSEYYAPSVDMQHATYPKPPEEDLPKSEYRQFEKSMTYRSLKHPLKPARLAGPFPDPVKVMPSDKTSDQEKADQRTAEARLLKGDMSTSSRTPNFSTSQRHYSKSKSVDKDDRKCKKIKIPVNEPCPKMKGPGCIPPESISCDRDYPFKKCQKKCAPYPAYSEFCHTIPDEKPSECKLCPWRPADHPTFKSSKKRRYHTSAAAFCPRRRLQEKRQLKMDRKHGWVKQDRWQKQTLDLFEDILMSTTIPAISVSGLTKKPCPRPKRNKCPPGSTKKDNKKKKGKKNKKSKKSGACKTQKKPKTGKCSKNPKKTCAPFASNDSSWITLANAKSKQLPNLFDMKQPFVILADKKKQRGRKCDDEGPTVGRDPEKCKRRSYGGCKTGTSKPNCEQEGWGPCKPAKKKKRVKDCPEPLIPCKNTAPMQPPSVAYLLAKKKGGKMRDRRPSKKEKCPKVDVGICRDEEDYGPDGCGPVRNEGTRRCPADLLIKRKKPAKRPHPDKWKK